MRFSLGQQARERERKRKRKGALYDDDVNDDEYVLRDDDDDAKNRPAIYAPRADDASSQSAPRYTAGGMAAAPFDDDASSPSSSSSSASSSSQYWTRTGRSRRRKTRGENNNRTKTKMSGPGSTSSDVGEHSSNAGSKHVSSFLSWPLTASCGALNSVLRRGEKVSLCGWVDKQRDMGGICFADVRDHSGLVQIVGAAEGVHANQKQIDEILSSLRSECVVKVVGTVRERNNKNKNIKTGEVEVEVESIEVLNAVSKSLPFSISESEKSGSADKSSEEVRLKNRVLDLRRPKMLKNLKRRHEAIKKMRKVLEEEFDFIEIETPVLSRPTPEGARDYLVPARTAEARKLRCLPRIATIV